MEDQEYKDAIPKCCGMKTIDEHKTMMLCWGITSGRV